VVKHHIPNKDVPKKLTNIVSRETISMTLMGRVASKQYPDFIPWIYLWWNWERSHPKCINGITLTHPIWYMYHRRSLPKILFSTSSYIIEHVKMSTNVTEKPRPYPQINNLILFVSFLLPPLVTMLLKPHKEGHW
jgi:hypothetical protein